MTSDSYNTNISKVESIRTTILKSLDNSDIDFALELIDYWDSVFPMEGEGRSIFLFTKLQIFLRRYELSATMDSKETSLRDAIETGNDFFAANEAEGYTMDSEVCEIWYKLVDLSVFFAVDYSKETGEYRDDELEEECDYDDDECEDIDEFYMEKPDPIFERIGRVNIPKFKPKPPRKYDDSLKSKLLKAVDRHLENDGDIDHSVFNLLRYICEEFDIEYGDFYNSIFDY